MSKFDIEYNRVIKNIIDNGIWDRDQNVRPKWKDGTPAYTKAVISERMFFDGSEAPILTTKKVYWKAAIKELPIWIWQKKSNRVQDLRDMGVNIWNEWELSDGTIGKAYGWQLGKRVLKLPNTVELNEAVRSCFISQPLWTNDPSYALVDQVDYLLFNLKYNPASRRHIVTLWDIQDLNEMSLTPCVWHTQWLVKGGKLHLIVGIRSNDIGLGNPFNVFQYYVLQRMIAQVTGYEIGTLTFNINDCHIYERHIKPLKEQIQREIYPAPELWINPEINNFYDFGIDDFKLIGYKHGEPIRMEIAE